MGKKDIDCTSGQSKSTHSEKYLKYLLKYYMENIYFQSASKNSISKVFKYKELLVL